MTTTRSGARRRLLIAIAAVMMLQLAAAQQPGRAAGPIHKGSTTMLFPVLRFGPNNQKRDLRHTLALAKHLGPGFGVVLTGFWRHYFDLGHKWGLNVEPGSGDLDPEAAGARSVQQAQASDASAGHDERAGPDRANTSTTKGRPRPCFSNDFLPFDAVLSRDPISKWLPATANVDELKQMHGWDGQLDALAYLASGTQDWLHLGHRDIEKALSASNVTVASHAVHISVPTFLNCNESMVQDLRKQLSKHRVVAVVFLVLGSLERPHMHLEEPTEPKEACPKAIWQANRLLQPAAWIDRLARHYITKHLGGPGARFLAVHLRPYPDTCLELWHAGIFDASRLHRKCHKELEDLHLRAAPCALSLMRRNNVTQLFVMVHPVLRPVTTSLLSKVGLQPQYLDLPSLEALAGCSDSSATFAALVEEQVAVHATAGFLGTSTSSISQSIAFARMGQGEYNNVFFETAQDMC